MEKDTAFAVIYTGLSDSDPDGNGYTDVELFWDIDKARERMQQLISNEKEFCKEEGRTYNILDYDENEDFYHMEWYGGSEQVIIQIRELKIS